MSKVLLVACVYLAVHAGALALTQSGDWGLGWVSPDRLMGLAPGVLPAVIAGALLVFWSAASMPLWHGFRRVGGWLGVAGFSFLVLAGTLLRPWAREYAGGLGLTATFYFIELSLLCAAAAALPESTAAKITRWIRVPRPGLPWLAAGWTLIVSSILSWVAFERVPHVPDEVAYWFQAKYFAAGYLYLPAPPDVAAFELPHVLVADGKWYSIFPPGWPAVLAIGMWIGIPWLINPMLGAASILLLHALVSDMYSRRTADVSVVLVATSPMFLLMSAGLMSHALSLVLALVTLIGWRRGVEGGNRNAALVGGLALGGLALTRPFEAAIFTTVLAAWGLFGKAIRRRAAQLAMFLVVGVVTGATTLLYNQALTGRPSYDPITKYFDERYYPGSNRLGFGADVGNTGWQNDVREGHSPVEAIVNSHRNAYLLNLELFGWAVGSLAGITVFLLFGAWSRADVFFASLAVAVAAGLGLYWYAGADYGARYWYQMVIPLAILTARGIETLVERARRLASPTVATGRAAVAIGIACVSAIIVVLPWRAATKYYHYRGMGAAVARLAQTESFQGALVFVRGAAQGTPFSRYSAAAVFNPPTLQDPGTVFVRDLDDASKRRVECAFAGRVVRGIDTSALPGGRVVITDEPRAAACSGPLAAQGGAQ